MDGCVDRVFSVLFSVYCSVYCSVYVDTYLRSHPTIQYTVYSYSYRYSTRVLVHTSILYNGDDGSDDDRYDRMIYDTMICYEL